MKGVAYEIEAMFRALAVRERHLLLLCVVDGIDTVPKLAQITAYSELRIRGHIGVLVRQRLITRLDVSGRRKFRYEVGPAITVTEDEIKINVSGYQITIGRHIQQEGA